MFSKWTWIGIAVCFSLCLLALRKSSSDPNGQASSPLFYAAATPIAATDDGRDLYHYYLSLEPPQAKSPAKDALKSLTMGQFRGKLIYSVNAFFQTEPSLRPFLFLRQIGPQTAKTNPVAIYEVKSPISVFDPQFSPDGNNVLFKAGGCCEKGDRFFPFIWDMQTHRIKQVTRLGLAALEFSWSPDSRYITYIYGGNNEGEEGEKGFEDGPVRLFLYDLKTSQSHRVAQNPAVIHNAWTRQGTFLYSFVPEKRTRLANGDFQREIAGPPDIYEVSAAGGAARLVIRHGCRPAPSPDGKWIAFFSELSPDGANLVLFNRMTQQRRLIRRERESFTALGWTPDSKHLIAIKTTHDEKSHGTARISTINPNTLATTRVAVLHAQDITDFSYNDAQPEFKILAYSQDGKILFVKVIEPKHLSNGDEIIIDSLRAVNLHTGAVTTLCKSEGSDFDWRPDS